MSRTRARSSSARSASRATWPTPALSTQRSRPPKRRQTSDIPAWQRWNDYGIGLLRESNGGSSKGDLRQAEAAFRQVEALDRPDGPLNLARVYFKEGRLDEASEALQRAASFDPPAYPWTLAWLSAQIERQYGHLDRAVTLMEDLAYTRFAEARRRGFDFSRDNRVLNALGEILFERARHERRPEQRARRLDLLGQAKDWLEQALVVDPEVR